MILKVLFLVKAVRNKCKKKAWTEDEIDILKKEINANKSKFKF